MSEETKVNTFDISKIKVPWYARVIGRLRAWKRARDIRNRYLRSPNYRVTVIEWYLDKYSHRWFRIYYNCIEYGNKKRTCKITFDHKDLKGCVHKTMVYNCIVEPWLDNLRDDKWLCDEANRVNNFPSQVQK